MTETKKFLEKLSNETLCIDLKNKNKMGFIYYNPDSDAGGQLVFMYLTYKEIQNIYERVINDPWAAPWNINSQFLAILESEALCDLIDCDADLFRTAIINLMPKKSVCDYNQVSITTYVDERLKGIENNKRADESEFYGQLIDAVEDFLDERDVTWPNPEREDCEDAAIIFGDDYDELRSAFQNIIENWSKMVNTETISSNVKSGYSEDYKRIREDAEHNWPEWKITAYNDNFAVSTYAKKIASAK